MVGGTSACEFDLLVSELVLEASAGGDTEAAQKRLAAIRVVPVLRVNDAAIVLADGIVSKGLVPVEAAADALHISIAGTNGVDFLLTWNCKHLANAAHRQRIEQFVEEADYGCPIICTPEELMED